MELGVPSYLINATLLGVLAQRLVRTLCKECKQPDEEASQEALAQAVKPWKLSGSFHPYKPVGCVDCRMTGFRGRMGLYELLTVTETLKAGITKEPSMDALRRQAVRTACAPAHGRGPARGAGHDHAGRSGGGHPAAAITTHRPGHFHTRSVRRCDGPLFLPPKVFLR